MGLIVLLIIIVLVIMATTLRKDAREQSEGQPREEALYVPPMTYNQWARINGVQQDPARPDFLP